MAGQGGGIWNWLGGADNVTATVLAVLALAGIFRAIWRRTVRRRTLLRAAVNRLAIGTNEEYVRSLFDAPAYGQVDGGNGYLAWVTPYGNIAVYLVEGRVGGFVFTVTDITFKFDPKVITLGYIQGYLGRVTFEAAAGSPAGQYYSVGARRYFYSENYYHGNPGGYLHFALSCSDSSAVGAFGIPLGFVSGHLTGGDRRDPSDGDIPAGELAALTELHVQSRPNTVAIFEHELISDALVDGGAIDGDVFRLFPRPDGRWLRLERLFAKVLDAKRIGQRVRNRRSIAPN